MPTIKKIKPLKKPLVHLESSSSGKPPASSSKKVPLWRSFTESKPKNFSIGQDVQPKRDLRRFLKWPHYVTLQRKKRVLAQRLKVPAPVARMSRALDKNTINQTLSLLDAHKPLSLQETKAAMKAAAESGKEKTVKPPPRYLTFGIQQVVRSIEKKKAKLVVIAADVEPVEIVLVLPNLCRKMAVPYVIVKSKARLGQIIHRKTAACIAITDCRPEKKQQLANVVTASASAAEHFNTVGGGKLGAKTTACLRKREKSAKKGTLREA